MPPDTTDTTGTDQSDPTPDDEAGVPQSGGSLTVAVSGETVGLDPVVTTGGGNSGSSEVAAIHDTIMWYNADSGEYEPRTAESLTANDDFTEWELKIRSGITFTDGTDYDAEAVVAGIRRHSEQRSANASLVAKIVDYRVDDPLTVTFVLDQPWVGFPFILSNHVGSIPSPTAVAQCDPGAPARECGYNVAPVGAGPFVLDGSFSPGQPIVLKRNPNYWGGEVHLHAERQHLRFVPLGLERTDRSPHVCEQGDPASARPTPDPPRSER